MEILEILPKHEQLLDHLRWKDLAHCATVLTSAPVAGVIVVTPQTTVTAYFSTCIYQTVSKMFYPQLYTYILTNNADLSS